MSANGRLRMAASAMETRKAGAGRPCRELPYLRAVGIPDPGLSIILSYPLSIVYRSPVAPPVCLTPYNPL